MMLKPIRLCILSLALCGGLRSQTTENHYAIKFHSVAASSRADMESVLYKITGASTVRFNAVDSSFMLSTPRLLDKKVISGRLLKYYYPVSAITHLEKDTDPFPVLRNSGDRNADGLLYEQEKQAWVKKYPEAYKKMLEKK